MINTNNPNGWRKVTGEPWTLLKKSNIQMHFQHLKGKQETVTWCLQFTQSQENNEDVHHQASCVVQTRLIAEVGWFYPAKISKWCKLNQRCSVYSFISERGFFHDTSIVWKRAIHGAGHIGTLQTAHLNSLHALLCWRAHNASWFGLLSFWGLFWVDLWEVWSNCESELQCSGKLTQFFVTMHNWATLYSTTATIGVATNQLTDNVQSKQVSVYLLITIERTIDHQSITHAHFQESNKNLFPPLHRLVGIQWIPHSLISQVHTTHVLGVALDGL